MPGAGGAEAPEADARKKSHDDDEASGLQREASEEWDVVSRSELSSRAPSPAPTAPPDRRPGSPPPLARVERAPSPATNAPARSSADVSGGETTTPPPLFLDDDTAVFLPRELGEETRARARVADPAESEPSRGEEDEEPFWLLATLRRARADAARRASNLLRALALAWSRPDAPAAEPARRRRKTTKPPASEKAKEEKKNTCTSRRRTPRFGDRGRGGGRNQHRQGGVAGLAVAVAIAGALARWAFGRSRDAGGPASAPPEGFAREVL